MQGREFVVGDTVTVADLLLAYALDWANELRLLALPESPLLHEADALPAEGTAAHRRGVRRHPALTTAGRCIDELAARLAQMR